MMFTPRLLSRVVSSSACSSSLLACSPQHAAAALTAVNSSGLTTTTANSHRWLSSSLLSSSLSSPSSSSSSLFVRNFSGTAIPSASVASGADGSTTPFAPVSNTEVQTLLNRVEVKQQGDVPERLTANQYAHYLKQIQELKPNIQLLHDSVTFLEPNRQDPTVNNSILELYSEAFESNWSEEQRKQVAAYLEQEHKKGGDAALVVGINKLLEKRVTIHGIINNLGGWYPLLGLASVIALSKELVIVNEELLMVTNFLAVFAGVYFSVSDTAVEQYTKAKEALAKKFYEHRKLEIDVNKVLLAAYDTNPKIIALLENFKKDVNNLINKRSRAVYLKKKADIQKHFIKALDAYIIQESQAEGNVRKQIIERFGDYMEIQFRLKKLKPDGFFQDGMITALTAMLTGKPIAPDKTPLGLLVKQYIQGALWTVDWKNLKFGKFGLKYLGVDKHFALIDVAARARNLQERDILKFQQEHPNSTVEDYQKLRGKPITIGQYLYREIKKNPQKVKEAITNAKKEKLAWRQELKTILQKEKEENEKAATAAATQVKPAAEKQKAVYDGPKKLEEAKTHMTNLIRGIRKGQRAKAAKK